jgi:DNA ligase (NAD+)
LKSISGIGDETADSLVSFFHDESNKKNIRRLLQAGVQLEAVSPARASPVAGKTFVITGSLRSMKRSEVKDLINRRGARLASSVSSNTDYLVVGESPGQKLEKAKSIGISLLEEGDFLKLLESE